MAGQQEETSTVAPVLHPDQLVVAEPRGGLVFRAHLEAQELPEVPGDRLRAFVEAPVDEVEAQLHDVLEDPDAAELSHAGAEADC